MRDSRAEVREALVQELRRCADLGQGFGEAIAARFGINSTDLKCASIVDQSGPLSAGRLAELTGLTTGAITGVIDRLERADLVRRERDPSDRRQVILRSVPERGADFDRILGPFLAAMAAHCEAYSEEELERMVTFLRSYAAILGDEAARLRATQPGGPASGAAFSAPLGAVQSGRLEIPAGASAVRLQADPTLNELFRAEFTGREPSVRVQGGSVRIEYARFSLFDLRKLGASIALNTSIPWKLELHGGISKLVADLRGLTVESISCKGGTRLVTFVLGPAVGAVPIRIVGGSHRLVIRRPPGVPVSARVSGGATRFALDSMYLGAVGGQTRLESNDYVGSTDRYDVEVTGGASGLTIETYED